MELALRNPDSQEPCMACGSQSGSQYCGACGERRPSPNDERLGPFLREQWQEATSADGKLWATAKAMFVPGKLTTEFFVGRRGLYVRPVRLFLVVNLILFFLLSGNDGTFLKGPLPSHFDAMLYGPLAEGLANVTADTWGTDLDAVQSAFDEHATSLAPSLLGVLIPSYALLFGIVFWRRRASALRHLVLATHIVSALMAGSILLAVAISTFLSIMGALTGCRVEDFDIFLVPTLMTAFGIYLGVSVMRVYRLRLAYAVGAGALLATLGFMMAFWLFRLVLFFVTFLTLDAPMG